MKLIVKTNLLFIFVLFLNSTLFADYKITRGPDVGEIYYIGPTVTGEGIYHSIDFGQTAICVDSISNTVSLCADLTNGSLYCVQSPDNLFYSNNYGCYGSWIFRPSEGSYEIESGRNEGEIFQGSERSSIDYGISFIQHSLNGCICSQKEFEIDNQDSIGYILGAGIGPDSLLLLISYDNFENLELQTVFDWHWSHKISLSRGTEQGELYLYKTTIYNEEKELLYSSDFGETWELKNSFNCPNLPIKSITGGRQMGELFMNVEYLELMGNIKHTYIYHSLNYGETFTIYHPFSHGDEPIYADFEAAPIEGTAPLTVHFTDLSNGYVASTWEWDFQNDGILDSYLQNPVYTYQDTGYYSVRLSVHPLAFYPATRYNYIHVTESNSTNHDITQNPEIRLSNYPNPFNPVTMISLNIPENINNPVIEIYNLKGQLIKRLPVINNTSIVNWNAEDLSSGIYLYKLNFKNSPTYKMLLLK